MEVKSINQYIKGIIKQIKSIDYKKQKLLIAFLSGVCLATIIVNWMCIDIYDEVSIYSEYYIERHKNIYMSKSDFLFYVFTYRLKETAIIIVLNMTYLSNIANIIYCAKLGLSVSLAISSMTLMYGPKAIILYIISIFPHYIVLILSILMMYRYINQKNKPIKDKIFMLAILLGLLIIEALLEALINLPIINYIL